MKAYKGLCRPDYMGLRRARGYVMPLSSGVIMNENVGPVKPEVWNFPEVRYGFLYGLL